MNQVRRLFFIALYEGLRLEGSRRIADLLSAMINIHFVLFGNCQSKI